MATQANNNTTPIMTNAQAVALVIAYQSYCAKYHTSHPERKSLTDIHEFLVSKGYEYEGGYYLHR